jgi:glycosyltransferase involved in cell wall biosynthesis
VIFQNPDDRDILLSLGALGKADPYIIRGSGVVLCEYPYLPEPEEEKFVVVMAARLLRDKGVFEFVEAARLLRNRGLCVQMRLIGSPDPGNPTSVTQRDVENWRQEGVVELLGFRRDVAAQYAAANIVCLPSYREGLPKSLVEAAACGRAVVTTDVPGCRDAIFPSETGLLVPVKNAKDVADAIQKLVEEPALRHQMGAAGRKLAEDAFAIEKIVELHINIYMELLGNE